VESWPVPVACGVFVADNPDVGAADCVSVGLCWNAEHPASDSTARTAAAVTATTNVERFTGNAPQRFGRTRPR
jgi:hypothetical protein